MELLKRLLSTIIAAGLCTISFAQGLYTFSGTVTDKESTLPVEFATIIIEATGQWAIADAKGQFTIKSVRPCTTAVTVSCLGYVTDRREITISKDILSYKISLNPDNLALETAVVTAKENSNSTTTSRVIDKTALDHVQMLNITDVGSLMPGGSTTNPTLIGEHNFSIRSGGAGEGGNQYFGAAVEVDGARLSNNGSFTGADLTSVQLRGASTNNIASSNVESVEVISGVASVEYGDMTSGVVKINTQKGRTPYTVTLSTTPGNKQISFSKGWGLRSRSGQSAGVINSNLEYTRSISEPMSPYTAYDRKQLSLTYSHTFTGEMPLKFSVGVTGNLGGSNSAADPDTFKDSYSKVLDNVVRGNMSLEWLLNRSWITNLEFKLTGSYSDKSRDAKTYYSQVTSTSSLHGLDEGYFISTPWSEGQPIDVIRLAPGYWSNVMKVDDRPIYFKGSLKANWARDWGRINNKVKLGADLSGDKNLGRGQYTDDYNTAPSFREWRYDAVPFMFNAAAYLEDNLTIGVGQGRISVVAGIRNDNTIINGSSYGTTSSWSPRFSAKYTILDAKGRSRKTVKSLAVRAGWGKSVKLPSFAILYPQPTYFDYEVFRSTASADNIVNSAYYILPRTVNYNPGLKWQENRQSELGFDIDVAGMKIGLAAFYAKTLHSYRLVPEYEAFNYTYTSTSAVQGCTIPAADRIYSIDGKTGQITISDRTGVLPQEKVASSQRRQFISSTNIDNDDNPIHRYGVEWTIDFPKIKAINTTIRMDGNYYGYKSLYTDMSVECPATTVNSEGVLFPYKAYYYGGDGQTNGTRTNTIRNNITIITHIPKARLIVSLKVESCLLKQSQALSERLDGTPRSYSVSNRGDALSFDGRNFYDGEGYTVTFPDYYMDMDGNRYDFLPAFKDAKQNNPKLFSDLSKFVVTTNFNYIYKNEFISPWFCANISVTKEIGKIASISFYANNFFNNTGQVYSSKTGNYSSVSNYIPSFYYGLTLRLKF